MPEADAPLPAPLPEASPPARDTAPGERLHLEAYQARDPAWAQTVAPDVVFAQHPDLALALPAPPAAPTSRARWVLNGAMVAAVVLLVASHDWQLWRWFRPLPVAQRVTLSPEPAPRGPGRLSAISRGRVEALNAALERRDWDRATTIGRQLLEDPVSSGELRRDPSAWLWLGDTAIASAVAAGDLLDGEPRRQRYRDAVAAHARLTADGTSPGLLADYGLAIATFYLQGGVALPETAIPAPELAAAEALLATVGRLRLRFGPELEASRALQQRLLLVEGWTLARRLCESGRSAVFARFNRANPDHQRRWERLAALLEEGREPLAAERDFLRLQLHFWETAHSFCFNPFSASETVQIGTWTASEADIESRIAQARAALGPSP